MFSYIAATGPCLQSFASAFFYIFNYYFFGASLPFPIIFFFLSISYRNFLTFCVWFLGERGGSRGVEETNISASTKLSPKSSISLIITNTTQLCSQSLAKYIAHLQWTLSDYHLCLYSRCSLSLSNSFASSPCLFR